MVKASCAVVGCCNNQQKLTKWKESFCEEHLIQKKNCVCLPPYNLYVFPSNLELRKKWEKNINRVEPIDRTVKRKKQYVHIKRHSLWTASEHDRICSHHFIDGIPTEANPAPTLKMGHTKCEEVKPKRKLPVKRALLPQYSMKTCDKSIEEKNQKSATNVNIVGNNVNRFLNEHQIDTTSGFKVENDHSYSLQCSCVNLCCVSKQKTIQSLSDELIRLQEKHDTLCKEMETKTKQYDEIIAIKNDELSHKNELCETKTKQIESQKQQFKRSLASVKNVNLLSKHQAIVSNVLSTDQKTKFYTGLPTIGHFDLLFRFVKPKCEKMKYWKGRKNTVVNKRNFVKKSPKKSGCQRKLSMKCELILVLMKLRLGLTNIDLADRFGVLASTVSSIFNTWVKVLAKLLKFLIHWPDKISVKANLPIDFAKLYPNARCILDCTEFFIETPKNLKNQAITWSDYKHHNTVKVLVAITPRGSICFLSKAWGGRASDRHITLESGILDKVDPTDQLLVDRGFLIKSEVVSRNATLVMPPPAGGHNQMLTSDVQKTKNIANLRIHVERAIQRIKCFAILKNQLSITHLPLIDDIVLICSAICNFSQALCR